MEPAEQPAGPASAAAAAAEHLAAPEQLEQERREQDVQQDVDTTLHTLPGLEGQWTLAQLVEMEMNKDPRFAQVRRSALPPAFWDVRRRARNRERTLRNYERRKRKGDPLREAEAARKAALTPAQAAAYEAEREAAREAAKAAAAAQRAAVAAAMASGLRVVVDCSLSAAASDREVRSLCKQLQECAAANKRARRPVSLQFAGFAGPVRRFAVEGMHADRWPAAAGHEAPLAQLFPARQLVVLSPDAQEPLGELQADKVYVIGGLVDRTVAKGASLGLAQRCGAAAARLPIAEHLGATAMAGGKGVLNVDDVFTALLAVHAGDGWASALDAAIPRRFRQQAGGSQQSKGQPRQPAERRQQGQQQQQDEQEEDEQQQDEQQQQQQQQDEQQPAGGQAAIAMAVEEGGQAAAPGPEGGSLQPEPEQHPAAAAPAPALT